MPLEQQISSTHRGLLLQRQRLTEVTEGPGQSPASFSWCPFRGNYQEKEAPSTTSLKHTSEASTKSTQVPDTSLQDASVTDASRVGISQGEREQYSNTANFPSIKKGCPESVPPKPVGNVSEKDQNIVFSWNMRVENESPVHIKRYELFILQGENSLNPHFPSCWMQIGTVDALPLPMACTLTQFCPGIPYNFVVRAIASSGRAGPFSEPCTIILRQGIHHA